MGFFKKIIDGIQRNEEVPEVDDDKTTDRYLRSLRREYRTHQEFHEKKELKRRIAQFYKDRFRDGMTVKMEKPISAKLKSKGKKLGLRLR